jgi:sugar lactone lactonase YvrE
VKRKLEIEIACSESNIVGESPVWSTKEQALYWVDIGGEKIHRLEESGQHSSWAMGNRVGAVGFKSDGKLIATMPDGIYSVALDVDGIPGRVHAEAITRPNLPEGVRMKEGKVDPWGRYWCGSTGATRKTRDGSLFQLSQNGSLRKVDEGFTLVNGIAFSPDRRTMIMADSPDDTVYAYELDAESGHILGRREFFSTVEFPGFVDGATFDCDGGFWCAFIYDWAVARIDPSGRLDRIVRLPVRHPTMCAFGGPNLDTLYVTTSTSHLNEQEKAIQPRAGMLFAIHGLEVQGVPEPAFAQS